MRKFEEVKVRCPFFREHIMPLLRTSYHIYTCKQVYLSKNPEKKVYHCPKNYMHIFLDAGNGNTLAFFELPTKAPMGRDENTPVWVQHIAFKVGSVAELETTQARLQAAGIEVIGPTDHTIFKSIYFFDPNGHRLELAADTATAEMSKKLDDVKWAMLDEWAAARK